MAYEVKPWMEPNCHLSVAVDTLTNRETHSREINEEYGEGGGLNANYRTVEAVAIAASILASNDLRYGVHFVFKTGSGDRISLDFRDEETRKWAESIFAGNRVEFS